MDDDDSLSTKDWEDFELVQHDRSGSGALLFENYKIIKKHLDSVSKKELVAMGWMSSDDQLGYFSDMFRQLQQSESTALFRKSESASEILCSVWLSRVRSLAEIRAISGGAKDFRGMSKDDLNAIAKLSVDVDSLKVLPDILAEKGILLIYCQALKGMKLDGAVFRLFSGQPVIGLSIRYSRLDYFWFTLLHELAHVCLHMDLLNNPILDDLDEDVNSTVEVSANRLAKNSFVSRQDWRNCEPKYNKGRDAVERFAAKIGIHRSIVAGMLRRENEDYTIYSDIVNEFNVREILFENR